MQNQQPQTTATPEVVTEDFQRMLVELRQQAISEGIALSKIDQYLLDRGDVAEGVKQIIRKEQGAVGAVPEGQATEVVGGPLATAETPLAQQKPLEKPELTGEVGMLDAKSQIEQIKQETAQARVEVTPAPEVPVEVEKPSETSLEQAKEQEREDQGLITQAAEKKEVPTTAGKQDTTTDVAVRTSLGMDGYKPSPQIASNAEEIAEKGDVSESKTWQATLLRRFLEMWGNFKALFSEN